VSLMRLTVCAALVGALTGAAACDLISGGANFRVEGDDDGVAGHGGGGGNAGGTGGSGGAGASGGQTGATGGMAGTGSGTGGGGGNSASVQEICDHGCPILHDCQANVGGGGAGGGEPIDLTECLDVVCPWALAGCDSDELADVVVCIQDHLEGAGGAGGAGGGMLCDLDGFGSCLPGCVNMPF